MSDSIQVVAKEDFIARQTRADPINALAELIWNSLDAEASNVQVELDFGDLSNGLSKIVVYDDGNGFSREDAIAQFGSLGGSWKRFNATTKTKKRMLHGKEGKGRYKAFALGRAVEWEVSYPVKKGIASYSIRLLEDNLKNVEISDEKSVHGKTGVIVQICDVKKDYRVFGTEEGLQRLTELFALYMVNYRDVKISIHGQLIDPSQAILQKTPYKFDDLIDSKGKKHPFSLEIIEWKGEAKGSLYLCNGDGFPMRQVESRLNLGSFPFSAYLKSPLVMDLSNDGKLDLPEMDQVLKTAIEEARGKIRSHFREKAAAKAQSVVDTWKKQSLYPYEGEAQTSVESVERQVFDIVAVNMHSFTPEFDSADSKTKALNLRMLRHAIERSPSDLRLILSEVLHLPKTKQQELAELLQETSLSSIITAAKTVADRLKFLQGLEKIVFDTEMKSHLKERSQLHKILAENTWIFGEQYNLWVSDKSLSAVLKKHVNAFSLDMVVDEPVKITGKKVGIVDLMFSSASRRHSADDIEHLIVELKAPKVKIGSKEILQTEQYAFAVAADERFNSVSNVRWHFWVLSNDMDDYAKKRIEGGGNVKQRLIHDEGHVKVGIKTWGELIEENRARLQFFQEKLNYTATDADALKYLQERHKQYLEGVIEPLETQEEEQEDTIKMSAIA